MEGEGWSALHSCISEGRSPSSLEVDFVAAKIWQESIRSSDEASWKGVAIGSDAYDRAVEMANLALRGSAKTD